jgi:hypothetical protein
MTDWMMQSTERDPRKLLGNFLQARTHNAKDLGRKIGCDPRAAEGYRAGRYWPAARHWPAIVAAFGRDVTEVVFFPDAAEERLTREVAALEQQLAERRAVLRVVATGAAGVGSRLAQAPPRPGPRVAKVPSPVEARVD